ncbi:MAG: bacillithiol biosynthesis cysteine-adding enzyme BshC [Algoriphagus sp.]|uniref:bacillithiol biosynthesis cysteine-adding enzyme BshC n=1 Tax=Algoriphagus sp. TaxID=1872435 RepID=UPI0017C5B71E|nr:bacillithiol biosynthesis cysteine-adding enzyme BshC [Algoriphagus sp.]NVJ86887.1 bacillithiol biosynthesis cysteine-adding enzyme BshC [Algoriphagus sp.]
MKHHCIDLKGTGQFSDFFLDYLEGKAALRPFYAHLPKIESFQKAIEEKTFSDTHRETLIASLRAQYDGVDLFEEEEASLQKLAFSKTFTVTTGHQLNLYTGPLYFIYKIVSTIRLAEELKKAYPAYDFVPIYWMATEDHDFDEINYFKLDGKKYEWNSDQKGAVGNFELDYSFREFEKSIPFVAEVFKSAYGNAKTLKEAVLNYVHELFGKKGLLVVDAQSPSLKGLFREVMFEDVFSHTPHKEVVLKTESLESLGYSGQIFPREINFFYMDHGIRERIEQQGEEYVVLNSDLRFTRSELEKIIEEHPERLSPNVVLRPLYQETILPNLAYLGGPAEVVYWLQLKGVFDHFDVPFPILLPRNFALVLEPLIVQKMEELGWSVSDLFRDFDDWKKKFVAQEASVEFECSKERIDLAAIFDNKGKEAEKLEKSLGESFEAAKVRALKILDQMGAKVRKAEERRLQVQIDRAKAIFDYIQPGGSPQERVVNMMQFYLADPSFIEKLYAVFDPLDFCMNVIEA